MAGTRERLTITIAPEVRARLEAAVPKSERSKFVESALGKALESAARKKAIETIHDFPSVTIDGENSTEIVRRIRAERAAYLLSRHDISKK